jgi:Tfp pilus assembly protein PilX
MLPSREPGRTRATAGRRHQAGVVLLTVLVLLVLFELLGMAYLRAVHIDAQSACIRLRSAWARHCAEGAFEVLAARREVAAGEHRIAIAEAAVRVAVTADGDGGWTLEVAGIEGAEDGPARPEVQPAVAGRLRPKAGGGWRLETRFR